MIKVNGKEINIHKFSNHEIKIRNIESATALNNEIIFKYESDEDLIHLMFVKKHLDELNNNKGVTTLVMPYIPYSRMDRTEGENVFTLKYVANFINSLNFDKVYVLEAHSNVSLALFDRIENENYSISLFKKCAEDINFDYEKDFIVFPDAGAAKRYKTGFGSDINIIVCEKSRDYTSGDILNMSATYEKEPQEGFKCIIIDDLCSYGRTPVGVSKLMHDIGAGEIYLCITHCEDGIFKGEVFTNSPIDKVYTTDSILTELDNAYTSKMKIKKLF